MQYRVVAADPAWSFGDRLPGAKRGAERNYEVMTVDRIRGFLRAFGDPCAEECLLFLWRVASQVEEAYSVVRAWGFVPKTELVWRKLTPSGLDHFGMGRILRASHESCIVAARGKYSSLILNHSTRSMFSAPVPTDANGRIIHSAKPDAFYAIVERLVSGPRLELFARRRRTGWDCFGQEVDRVA